MGFIDVRIIDVIDILLVALIMYQVYYLIKGTVAFSIFIGIVAVLSLYFIVDLLEMKLLSSILGALIGGGAIALIILFQQELRRFLVFLGTRYFPHINFSFDNYLERTTREQQKSTIDSIYKASVKMARSHTGALIVISRGSSLNLYIDAAEVVNSAITSRMLESIFMKNGPLHDGAVIITNNRIAAARCILPFTNKTEVPSHFGMRHRAGLGISENTDAFVIIISEERGEISVAEKGEMNLGISEQKLLDILTKRFLIED